MHALHFFIALELFCMTYTAAQLEAKVEYTSELLESTKVRHDRIRQILSTMINTTPLV